MSQQGTAKTREVGFQTFGELIRNLRIQKGLTQKEVGYQIGSRQNEVSRLEANGPTKKPAKIDRLVAFFGIDSKKHERLIAKAKARKVVRRASKKNVKPVNTPSADSGIVKQSSAPEITSTLDEDFSQLTGGGVVDPGRSQLFSLLEAIVKAEAFNIDEKGLAKLLNLAVAIYPAPITPKIINAVLY